MCLRLNINAIKHTTEESIKVYKLLIVKNGYLEAPIMNYKYTLSKLNTLQHSLYIIKSWHKVYIEEGFYSFKSKFDAINYACSSILTTATKCIAECTIPKGSEYYTDNTVIVSNQIIINKILCAY